MLLLPNCGMKSEYYRDLFPLSAKSGVQVTSASGKSRLASVGRIFKFWGAKSPQTVDTQGFQPLASILFAGSGGR